jgi:hypothetical protein
VSDLHLRTATASDAGFLAEMLAVALDWRPGTSPRPSSELMPIPEIWHYIDGWPREGDFGLVAEVLRPVVLSGGDSSMAEIRGTASWTP